MKLAAVLCAALALGLGACAPSVDDQGFHTQRARLDGPGNSSGSGGMFGAARGICHAGYIGGCGGLVDRDDYQRLAADGKLRFTYADGSAREYDPAGAVTIGPISAIQK